MLPLTHLDGSDVVVIDDHGHQVPAVEVRIEPGFAVVSVGSSARTWLSGVLARSPDDTLAGAVLAAGDGHMHHCGAMRVVVCA